jgi:putative transposase
MSAVPQRLSIMALVLEAVHGGARVAPACAVLGFSERTFQRWQSGAEVSTDARTMRHEAPAHKFSILERAAVLAVANSSEFGHLPPSQIVPRLADQRRYVASESTFYRILREENQMAHRRPERAAQKRSKPRAVCATQPNQLYSWDITYLPTLIHGWYFYLYLFIDVFSRKIVAAQVFAEENGANASELLKELCRREKIALGQIVLHSDNGSPMKGSTMLATMISLGVMASLSRPSVSNDNPYSESLFKTLKYRPEYPMHPFADIAAARSWVSTLVQWYNHEHRHSAIRFVTPGQRHAGLDTAILKQRSDLYETAKAKNPLRWKRATRNWRPIEIVHLNPDQLKPKGDANTELTFIEKRAA